MNRYDQREQDQYFTQLYIAGYAVLMRNHRESGRSHTYEASPLEANLDQHETWNQLLLCPSASSILHWDLERRELESKLFGDSGEHGALLADEQRRRSDRQFPF